MRSPRRLWLRLGMLACSLACMTTSTEATDDDIISFPWSARITMDLIRSHGPLPFLPGGAPPPPP